LGRVINEAGLDIIKEFEGCELTAYQDLVGVWTVGYGHIAGVKKGMTITDAEAEQFLHEDLAATEAFVAAATKDAPTSDNQFSAMVALTFNIGTGRFRSSSVLRSHLAGKYDTAAADFLKWDKATIDGKLVEVKGLRKRRDAESKLYATK